MNKENMENLSDSEARKIAMDYIRDTQTQDIYFRDALEKSFLKNNKDFYDRTLPNAKRLLIKSGCPVKTENGNSDIDDMVIAIISRMEFLTKENEGLKAATNKALAFTAYIQNIASDEDTNLNKADAFIESLVGRQGMKRHSRTFLEAVLGLNFVPNQGDLFRVGNKYTDACLRLEAFALFLAKIANTILNQCKKGQAIIEKSKVEDKL
jgi:hypothetical protein